jgi:hypothetical protein
LRGDAPTKAIRRKLGPHPCPVGWDERHPCLPSPLKAWARPKPEWHLEGKVATEVYSPKNISPKNISLGNISLGNISLGNIPTGNIPTESLRRIGQRPPKSQKVPTSPGRGGDPKGPAMVQGGMAAADPRDSCVENNRKTRTVYVPQNEGG